MLLYLARHAQTASSAVDSFNGRRELPLTERGQQQARKLGQRLSAVRFAAVYRSPLGRTAQTAALIAPMSPAQVVPGLTEIDYGEWEGLSPEQARERDRDRYDAWVTDPQAVTPVTRRRGTFARRPGSFPGIAGSSSSLAPERASPGTPWRGGRPPARRRRSRSPVRRDLRT